MLQISNWTGVYVGINGGYGFSGDSDPVVDTESFPGVPVRHLRLPQHRRRFRRRAGRHQFPEPGLGLRNRDRLPGRRHLGQVRKHGPQLPPGPQRDRHLGEPRALVHHSASAHRVHLGPDDAALRDRGRGLGLDRTWLPVHRNFGFTASNSETSVEFGYAVGGGVEHQFSPNLSLKLEYQFIDFGEKHYTAPLFFGPAPTVFTEHTDPQTDFHTIRIGLNWKIDNNPF